MASIPRQSELARWLGEHEKAQSVSLRDWIFACQERTGHNKFVQMFIYDNLGGDKGTLKTNLRPATHEVARHNGIIGDWSVEITDQLLEATIIFADSTLARIILVKTGDETMSQDKTLTKADIARMICDEGDTVPDLIAWTRNQPESRVPAIYNLKGQIWEQMMAFRDERLEKLPDVVSKASVRYLYHSTDKKDWMLYTIIIWILYRYSVFGMESREGKEWLLSYFKQIQRERMSHGPFVFRIKKKQGEIVGIKRKWPAS